MQIRIQRGQILTLTGNAGASGAAWWAKSGAQLVRAGTVDQTPLQLGPYTSDALLEVIMDEGDFVAEFHGEGDQVPTALLSQMGAQAAITPMASLDDATDATDVITQLNALLAALRTAGLMEEPGP